MGVQRVLNRRYFFTVRIIDIWNSLPLSLINCETNTIYRIYILPGNSVSHVKPAPSPLALRKSYVKTWHVYLGVVLCIVLCQFRRLRHLADDRCVVWTEPEGKKLRFRLDGTVATAISLVALFWTFSISSMSPFLSGDHNRNLNNSPSEYSKSSTLYEVK